MFDKVVTPSDVGKLNRLVIPKQHAEKYFPLDSSSNEKGLLLNFEDRNGKEWRFRYSYWNSSQSYVMTKGWSRFVKEKRLDAGDIVSFQRGKGELGRDRLYIDWRRRPDAAIDPQFYHHHHHHHNHFSSIPWSPLLMRPSTPLLPRDHHRFHFNTNRTTPNYASNSTAACCYGPGGGGGYSNYCGNVVNPSYSSASSNSSVFYIRSDGPQQVVGVNNGMVQWQAGGSGRVVEVEQQQGETMVYESVPLLQGKAAAKRLRLFGVNMDCPINQSSASSSSSSSDECDIIMSSSSTMPFHPSQQLRLYNYNYNYNATPFSSPPMPSSSSSNPTTQFLHKG